MECKEAYRLARVFPFDADAVAEVILQSLVPEHSAAVMALVVELLGHCLLLDFSGLLLGTGDGLLGVRYGHFGTGADHLFGTGADPLVTIVSGPARSKITDGTGVEHTGLGSGDTSSASGRDAASAGNNSLGGRTLSTRGSGGTRGGYNGGAPPWAATQNAMGLLGRIGGGGESFDHDATDDGFGLGVGNRELRGRVGRGHDGGVIGLLGGGAGGGACSTSWDVNGR